MTTRDNFCLICIKKLLLEQNAFCSICHHYWGDAQCPCNVCFYGEDSTKPNGIVGGTNKCYICAKELPANVQVEPTKGETFLKDFKTLPRKLQVSYQRKNNFTQSNNLVEEDSLKKDSLPACLMCMNKLEL
jgi:hypothetical protein